MLDFIHMWSWKCSLEHLNAVILDGWVNTFGNLVYNEQNLMKKIELNKAFPQKKKKKGIKTRTKHWPFFPICTYSFSNKSVQERERKHRSISGAICSIYKQTCWILFQAWTPKCNNVDMWPSPRCCLRNPRRPLWHKKGTRTDMKSLWYIHH